MQDLLLGKAAPKEMKDGKGKPLAKKGEAFTKEKIDAINLDRLHEMDFDDDEPRGEDLPRSSTARKTRSS